MSRLEDVRHIEADSGSSSFYYGTSVSRLFNAVSGGVAAIGSSTSSAEIGNFSLRLGAGGGGPGSAAITIPKGMLVERPLVPPVGCLRFNTDFGFLEVFKPDGWRSAGPMVEDPPSSVLAERTPSAVYDQAIPAGGASITGLSSYDRIEIVGIAVRVNPRRDVNVVLYDASNTQITGIENFTSSKQSNGTEDGWTVAAGNLVILANDPQVDPRTEFTFRMVVNNPVGSTGNATGHALLALDDPDTGTWSFCEVFFRVTGTTIIDRIDISSTGNFGGYLVAIAW